MSDKIRDAAANAIERFGEAGRWVLTAALLGSAAMLVIRAASMS